MKSYFGMLEENWSVMDGGEENQGFGYVVGLKDRFTFKGNNWRFQSDGFKLGKRSFGHVEELEKIVRG